MKKISYIRKRTYSRTYNHMKKILRVYNFRIVDEIYE